MSRIPGVRQIEMPITFTTEVPSNFDAALNKAAEKSKTKLLNTWADTYFRAINARARLFSQGTGGWKGLEPSTKKIIGVRGKDAILADSDSLLNATKASSRLPQGQVRRIKAGGRNFSIKVGIGGPATIGDGSKRYPSRGRTIGEIAAVHHFGLGKNLVPRRIIIRPPVSVMRKLNTQLVFWANKQLKKGR